MLKYFFSIACLAVFLLSISHFLAGCGQIGFPTGGAKDSLAPQLLKASPGQAELNVKSNKLILTFDEYIEVVEAQNNVLISPLPKTNPSINYNLKTVTIRLKDSLQPNTTYHIQFGNALKDVNEGNVLKNFSYVFSTGNSIDTAMLQGKVTDAETGLVDSTLSIVLYQNLADTAVQHFRPHYLTRVNGDGSFKFTNLSAGIYNVYAIKDGDGNKYYNLKTEAFAFYPRPIEVSDTTMPVVLYAYTVEKINDSKKTTAVLKPQPEKTLRLRVNLSGNLGLKDSLKLSFNNSISKWDSTQLRLTDTSFAAIPGTRYSIDSAATSISIYTTWEPGKPYFLLMPKTAIEDVAGHTLFKTDTLRFKAKELTEYARVLLRFTDIDLGKNPVLQLLSGNEIKASFPLLQRQWSHQQFDPGEYTIRMLYDTNKDGRFTPGDYTTRRQPELAITLPQKLSLRANWDNERDIKINE